MKTDIIDIDEIARKTIKVYETGSADQYTEFAYKWAIVLAQELLTLSGRVDKLVDTIDELREKLEFLKAMEKNDD